MKICRLHTLIIVLSLIAVMGMMGMGYAQWEDNMYLVGSVSSGYASVALHYPNAYDDLPVSLVVTEPGSIAYAFVMTNTGTVPMKLASKSDNIEFVCDEILSGESASGYLVGNIDDDRYGQYLEQWVGTIHMVALNDSWSQDVQITALVQAHIQKPVQSTKPSPLAPNDKPMAETTDAVELLTNRTDIIHD